MKMGITIASCKSREEIEEQFATLLKKAKKGFANVEEKEDEFTIFGRMKNDPNKQRKVAVQYVELCGLKKGDNQHSIDHNGLPSLSQSEIARQLGISPTELKRMLEIERKLTPEIKDLLDTGIISKTSFTEDLQIYFSINEFANEYHIYQIFS